MDNVTIGTEQLGTASTSAQREIIKDDNTTNERVISNWRQARRPNNTADHQSAALPAQPIKQQSGRHEEQQGNVVKVQISDTDPQLGLSSNEEVSDILPPFSGKLSVDTNLKLSRNDFKQSIQELGLTAKVTTEQLRAIPPYPTPYVLALFASKAYHGYKPNESEGDYEKRLELPSGWTLLTTAFNNGSTNGYFGAAYWHPEYQHVVIAHRGTQPTNFGADWADLKGVVFNNYVPQMNSATTFADSVSRVLSELDKKTGVNFQLFFTGHSLGGWLAQITTFTTEYLHRVETVFLKNDQAQGRFHPHTVVFDSPGSEKMLSRMKKSFDLRLQSHSIYLNTLDITSYLSAPNRINTCNSHLGTVYRIFTVLSDMKWTEKYTAAYNLATHSMDKILKAFNPTTGQVRKDEKSQLKVREVVDWPISGILRRGDEYKDFFKWAAHFNDYHPDVTDENFQIKTASGYYPIRYQTKLFDERSSSLSVFTNTERQFLERYHWLRGLPEFFKPAELFFALGHVYSQAQQQLQYFNLDNDKVHCESATALQKFIPYVKALIRGFPQIQQSTARALSSVEVRKRVYRSETKDYLAEIQHEPLDVERDVVGIEDFLKNPQQQVWQLVVEKNTRIVLTKVYRSWRRIEENTEQGQDNYTILKLKRLLTIHQQISLSELLSSQEITHHLLIVEFNTDKILNSEVAEQLFNDLLNVLNNKPDIKSIVITKSSDGLTESFKQKAETVLNYRFRATKDAPLTWSDLTSDSQQKLLEKKVDFQGHQVPINQLIDPQQPELINSISLLELIDNKLVIGDKLPISSGYDEDFYIDRTFYHQIAIKRDIFHAKQQEKFSDLLASTEQEFKQLCRQHPSSNIHLLKSEPGNKVIWKQSQGSLAVLRKYIDTHYSPENLNDLLQQAQYHKIILISATAGMGKTTVLTHLSKQLKQKFPTHWVVRIDLNDHTDALKVQTQAKSEKLSSDNAVEFISQKLLMLKTSLEQVLFKQCFVYDEKVKVALLLDGFDEISPSYKNTVIDLLQILKKSSVEQLWVTNRPHMKEELEDKLQQLSYTLKPFSQENQISFLTGFWKKELTLSETSQQRLAIYAKELIEKLAKSISDKETKFTGIPLQTRMLADSFKQEVELFNSSAKEAIELPDRLDLLELYERFINKKYSIYQVEKTKTPVSNVAAEDQRKSALEGLKKVHQRLALQVLFNEEQVRLSQDKDKPYKFSNDELARIGIVEIIDDRPHFVHRTFAEYFASDFLASQLQEQHQIMKAQDLLTQILLQKDYQFIRTLLNGQLTKNPPSKDALTKYGKYLSHLWSENRVHRGEKMVLHLVYEEGNTKIIIFLLDSLKNHKKTLKNLVLATTTFGENVLHIAASCGNWKLIEQLLNYLQDNFKSSALGTLKSLVLATTKNGVSVLHHAASSGNWEFVEQLLCYVQDNFKSSSPKTLKSLVLATTKNGVTVLHQAASSGNWEFVEQLLDYVKKNVESSAPGTLKSLVLANYSDFLGEGTVLHQAASRNWELVKQLLNYVKKNVESSAPGTLKSLVLATAKNGVTVLHQAASSGNWELVKQLLDYVKKNVESRAPGMLKSLVLANNSDFFGGGSVLHEAASSGNWELVEQLLCYVQDNFKSSSPKTLKSLVLATTKNGVTVLHQAASSGNWEFVEQLLDYVKKNVESRAPGTLKSLVLANDSDFLGEGSVLHRGARSGNWELVMQLLDYVKKNVESRAPGTLKSLVLATAKNGVTVLHQAASSGNWELVKQLLDYVKKNVESRAPGTLKSLVLANDDFFNGGSVLHRAASSGNWELVKQLLDYVKKNVESRAPGTLKSLVLATAKNGVTVLHQAASSGNWEFIKQLLDYVKKNVESRAPRTLKSLVLANNDEFFGGGNVLHEAARSGNWELVEQLLDYVKKNVESSAPGTLKSLVLATANIGVTVLHQAASSGNWELVKQLLDYVKKNVESRAPGTLKSLVLANDSEFFGGGSVLHKAARSGNWELVKQLLDYVKNNFESRAPTTLKSLVLATTIFKDTVLHQAAASGNWELVEQLLRYVQDNFESSAPGTLKSLVLANVSGYNGGTVLHRAAASGNWELVEQLLRYVQDNFESSAPGSLKGLVLATDAYGKTVLHRAANSSNRNLVKQLLDYVLDNFESQAPGTLKSLVLAYYRHYPGGGTVFLQAVECENRELEKQLLGYVHDLELNIKNNDGFTALNRAAQKGFWDIVVSLLKDGATINGLSVEQYDALLNYVQNSSDENKEDTLKLLETLKVSVLDNEIGSLSSIDCASSQCHKRHLGLRVV